MFSSPRAILNYSRSLSIRRFLATKRQRRAAAAQGKELDETPRDTRRSSLILPLIKLDKDWKPVSLYQDSSSTTPLPIDTPHHPDLFDASIHLPSLPTDWKDYESPTPLWDDMCALIGVTGQPLSTAEYMRMCLTHPLHGYYTAAVSRKEGEDDFDQDDYDDKNDEIIIGPSGDFVTAPEISQIFGECLGIWFMTQWKNSKHPLFQWLECGPGRGSLMIDLLRFCFHEKIHDTFGQACQQVHFVEASPVLRQTQRQNLKTELKRQSCVGFWRQTRYF